MIAEISTHLKAPTEKVWALLKKIDTFFFITRGMMSFTGSKSWPQELTTGTTLRARLIFFHFIPAWHHELKIVHIDENKKEILSNEKGGLIKKWNHFIQVQAQSNDTCVYRDQIDIDAGRLTFFVWLFANVFYRYRQWRWQLLLQKK